MVTEFSASAMNPAQLQRRNDMKQRIAFAQTAPEGVKALMALETYIHRSGIEPKLLELIKTRASQINGCGYCIDMHTKDARAAGETEQRLYLLSVWREAPCYTDRERAALAWTEAVTLLPGNDVSDELYAATQNHFSDRELADLTFAVIAINAWNRLAVPFRSPAGTYQSSRNSSN
jgi:AhpD family alkylhydroperoxidase